jgi:hypothetical protein
MVVLVVPRLGLTYKRPGPASQQPRLHIPAKAATHSLAWLRLKPRLQLSFLPCSAECIRGAENALSEKGTSVILARIDAFKLDKNQNQTILSLPLLELVSMWSQIRWIRDSSPYGSRASTEIISHAGNSPFDRVIHTGRGH